jgi:hypothetical protein
MKYTLEPNAEAFPNFATEDLTVNLSTDHSHITYNLPITKVNAEVSKYGWSTFSSDYKLDFTGITGLEAYAITGHSGNAITKSDALGVVAANAGVLLKGVEGENPTFYNIPVSAGAAYSGANLMVAGTGASISAEEGKTKYVLGVNDNGTTDDTSDDFAELKKVADTPATVAKGEAYLQFNEAVAASSLQFEGGASGIADVRGKMSDVRGDFYDLQGRRVAQPVKGLYIVNGKKYLVK